MLHLFAASRFDGLENLVEIFQFVIKTAVLLSLFIFCCKNTIVLSIFQAKIFLFCFLALFSFHFNVFGTFFLLLGGLFRLFVMKLKG